MDAQTKSEEFFKQFKKISFESKELILRPNKNLDYIFFIKDGLVKQYTITKNGEQLNLHIFKGGSYFPMMLLLSGEKNQYYYESIDTAVIYRAPAEKVLEFLKENPDVLFDLSARFAKGLSRMLYKTETTLFEDSKSRVISILRYLAEKFGVEDDGMVKITIPLTHSDIASWIGLQRETTSRQIESLMAQGMVVQTGKVFRINMSAINQKQESKK